MMVSFISIFCHVYLITSLLEPIATLNITISFFRQLEQKFMNDRTHIKGLKALDAAWIFIQIVSTTVVLLVRIFVLLCILLVVFIVELYFAKSQLLEETVTLSSSLSTTVETKKDNGTPLALSPRLLPTPPCENDDVSIPTKMSDSPISNHDDVVRPVKETKAIPAPNKPAPLAPTPPDEAGSKQPKQQTTENTNQDDVNCSEQPWIENATIRPDQHNHLPDIQKSSSSTIVTTIQHKLQSDKNSNVDSAHILAPDENDSTSRPTPPLLSSSDDSTVEAALLKEVQDTSSDMPDHTPNYFPIESTKSSPDGYEATKTMPTEEEKEDKNTSVSLPLLSPSGSLSSSLSTLNHTTHNNPQEKPTTHSEDQTNVSRLHRSFLKKQPQPQEHLKELDSSSHFPIPSHSSRTHVSNISAAPTPLGSSLSMKLSKLKKPGRRISQMFKKKNKQ